MMEYDGDLHVPAQYLVSPPSIDRTMAEYLCKTGIRQFSISETQKFGHVTYFFNGNKTGKFDEKLEEYVEIPSDIVPFEERPWMKCAEIADRVIAEVESGKWDLIKLNFPNGDMVGHTGSMDAAIIAMEAVDLALARLIKVAEETGYTMLITADHGNADEMLEKNKKGQIQVRTAHSLNPVPFIILDKAYTIKDGEYGLANVAPTVAAMFGLKAPECWEDSMI